jgi:hypothetical protein
MIIDKVIHHIKEDHPDLQVKIIALLPKILGVNMIKEKL